MDKNSFLIYLDYEEQFNLLTDEQVGQLMRAIIKYEKTGIVPKLEGMLKMAFSFIKTQLDRDREKYNKRCEQNKENAKKGGRPKKQKDNFETKKPNGFEKNQMDTKKPDNEDEEDNDDDNENDIDTNLLSNSDVEELQKIIIETLGSTNLTVIQEAISYLDTFPLEVIKEALVRAARKQKKWDYARGTLNNWIEDGLDTLEKIKANDLEFKSNNQAAKQAGEKLEQREYSEEDFNRLYANVKSK